MTEPTRDEIVRLLDALEEGDRGALDALFPLVYRELHALARARRRRWHGDYTLDTTALLHEAYLRLAGRRTIRTEGPSHFFALASRAMRQILCNYARDRRAQRRGGGMERLPLDEARDVAGPADPSHRGTDLIVALDEALSKLRREDERRCAVVECRFFGGMSITDTASALGISPRTVKRDWAVAQAWLQRELQGVR